jgi:hypothetical protein
MNAPHIIRALLNVATATQRAFVNSEPLADASHAHVINSADYDALCRALRNLDVAVGRKGRSEPGPLLAELALRRLLESLEMVDRAERLASMRLDQAAAAASFENRFYERNGRFPCVMVPVAPGAGIVRVNTGGAPGGPDVVGFVAGKRVEFDVAPGAGTEPPTGAGGDDGR